MPKSLAAACLLPVLFLSSAASADCARDQMQSCYALERERPSSGRGGLSAPEFCAADAVVKCRGSRTSPVGSGASQGGAQAAPKAAAPSGKETDGTTAIAVEGGNLRIVAGDPHGTKSSIRYNDNLVREFDGVYLSIRAVVVLDFGADTVLVYSTNPGGSGTVDGYGLASIGPKGRIYETELPVGSGRFEYHVAGDRISFELGLDQGREVRAVYANGRLDVTRSAAPKTGLKAKDCDFLYNGVLAECADARQTVCRYDDMAISMASQRPVNMMAADDPNFRRQDFEAACEQSCKTRRKPAFATFRKTVCQPR